MRHVCEATGKFQFASADAADAALRLHASISTRHNVRRAYRCEHCLMWHLTSRKD